MKLSSVATTALQTRCSDWGVSVSIRGGRVGSAGFVVLSLLSIPGSRPSPPARRHYCRVTEAAGRQPLSALLYTLTRRYIQAGC